MSLDEAIFLVERLKTTHHVKGQDISTKIKSGDRILVQRDDHRFHAWSGQQDFSESPLFSFRFYYEVGIGTGPPNDQGNPTNGQPTGDGKVNLSLYFENGGPYPTNEWRNIRNTQNTINDLDGKEFLLRDNTDLENGDIVRITEEGGDYVGFYSIKKDDNEFIIFDTQYTRNDGRMRTDIKRSTDKRPVHNSNVVLRFDIFRPGDFPFGTIQSTDLILANDDQGELSHVTGSKFESLFLPPPFVVTKPVIAYDGETNGYGQIKYVLVSDGVMSRPSDSFYGRWAYSRDDGATWYGNKYGPDGYYYFDHNVDKVKYTETHSYGSDRIVVDSEIMDFGPPINAEPLKLVQTDSAYMTVSGGMGLPTESWNLESTNVGLSSTTAIAKFECQVDGELFYIVRFSSEPTHDYVYIMINDEMVEKKSGYVTNSWYRFQNYQSVAEGDIIEIGYRKDSTVHHGYDKIIVDKLYLTEDVTKISRYADKAVWATTYLGYPLCRPNWANDSTWWGKFSICSGTSEDGWFFKSQYDSDGNRVGRFPSSGQTIWLMVNDRISSLKSYQCIGDGKSTDGYYRFDIPDAPINFSEGDNLYAFNSDPR